MPKVRSRREIVARCATVTSEVRGALARLPDAADDPDVVDAVWQAEGLGVLLWSLGRLGLPPYDLTFDHDRLLAVTPDGGDRAGAPDRTPLALARPHERAPGGRHAAAPGALEVVRPADRGDRDAR